MWARARHFPEPDIEVLRKRSKVLVIDDMELPAQVLFDRDGYHFERWPEIKTLSQLTDGHYDLILLDLQGVGLNENPELQGLGILQQIKSANPAQLVIAYSAQTQKLSALPFLELADAVLDKQASYGEYKLLVDQLLKRRATPGYFISVMNRDLGASAALVPKAVPKAINAFNRGNATAFERYIRERLPDAKQADRIISIISIGVTTAALVVPLV